MGEHHGRYLPERPRGGRARGSLQAQQPARALETGEYDANAAIPFSGPLPLGSSALAATRVMSPVERDAVIRVEHTAPKVGSLTAPREPRLTVRIWINDKVVYNSRTAGRRWYKALPHAQGRQYDGDGMRVG